MATVSPRFCLADDPLAAAVRAAAQKVEESVVRIRPVGSLAAVESEEVSSTPSTGIVLSSRGEILTSAFALQGNPQAVLVETKDGQRFPATVVATDFVRKLVLLQCSEGSWVPADLSEPDLPAPGEWAVGLGRFYRGDRSAVSVGVISAINRIHGLAIQTDVKVSPVNYGGPLIDLTGKIQGILVPLSPRFDGDGASAGVEWYDSGIGFAIPSRDLMKVVDRLRAGKDLKPGKLGLTLKPVSPFASELKVDQVLPGSPAEAAGIQSGDRLLIANERTLERPPIFESIIAAAYAGDVLNLTVDRSGMQLKLQLTLAENLPRPEFGFLGLIPLPERVPVAVIGAAGDGTGNVEVESDQSATVPCIVIPGGPASLAGLKGRIEVVSLNGVDVHSYPEFLMQVFQVIPQQETLLKWRAADAEPSEVREAKMVAGKIPSTLSGIGDSELKLLRGDQVGNSPPVRSEQEVADLGKCVVFRTSQAGSGLPGIVVDMTVAGLSEEAILSRWGSVLESHQLTLVIPQNSDSSALTSEDIPLIAESLAVVAADGNSDRGRVILVCDAAQADVARRLIFAPRSPIRSVVMKSGWFNASMNESLGRSRRSVLLFDSARDNQSRALFQTSEANLRSAGLRVAVASPAATSETDASAVIRIIADWSLEMKSL